MDQEKLDRVVALLEKMDKHLFVMEAQQPPDLGVVNVARMLRRNVEWVWRKIRARAWRTGEIPKFVKRGKLYLVEREALLQWLETRPSLEELEKRTQRRGR